MIEQPDSSTPSKLRLNSLENSRKSLTRIMRSFNSGDIPEDKFKALVYGFSHLLQYWKLERDLEIEKRITALEKRQETHRGN